MSMRGVNRSYTICEILREINDLHQSDTEHDKIIRKKLVIAEKMSKKMSKKMKEYNEKIFADWWEKNPDYKKNLEKRLSKKYCIGEK